MFAVRLLLRPSFSHTQVGLGDIKETPFCNVTEDVSLSEPKKGLTSTMLQLTVFQISQRFFLIIHTVCCCGVQRIWLVQPLTQVMKCSRIPIQAAAYGCLLSLPERSSLTHM